MDIQSFKVYLAFLQFVGSCRNYIKKENSQESLQKCLNLNLNIYFKSIKIITPV